MTGLPFRDRRQALLLLAGSLYDFLVMPETATGAMLRKNLVERAAAPMRWSLCLPCDGRGRVVDRYRREARCETCGGKGRVKTDSYTGQVVGSEESAPVPARTRSALCDRCHGSGVWRRRSVSNGQPEGEPSDGAGRSSERLSGAAAAILVRCPTCDGVGRREWSPFELRVDDGMAGDPATVLERAIERRDQAGSYHELEVCLAHLRRVSPHRHRVFWRAYVLGEGAVVNLTEHEAEWLEQATVDLLGMLPAELRVPRDLILAARAKRGQLRHVTGAECHDPRVIADRDHEIRRLASKQGRDVAAIAAEFHLSARQVQRIVYGSVA